MRDKDEMYESPYYRKPVSDARHSANDFRLCPTADKTQDFLRDFNNFSESADRYNKALKVSGRDPIKGLREALKDSFEPAEWYE